MSDYERGLACGVIAGIAIVLWFVLPGAWPLLSYALLLGANVAATSPTETESEQ